MNSTFRFETTLAGVTFDNRRALIERYASTIFTSGRTLETLPHLELRVRCADAVNEWGIDVLWEGHSMGWIPAKPRPTTMGHVPLDLLRAYAKVAPGPHPAPFILPKHYALITNAGIATVERRSVPFANAAIYEVTA